VNDKDKSKKELIAELNEMRNRISEYEAVNNKSLIVDKTEAIFKTYKPPSNKPYPFSEKTLIAITNLDFTIIDCNINTVNIFGFMPEGVIGKRVKEVCSNESIVLEFDKVRKAVRAKGLFKYQLDRETARGMQYLSFRITGNWKQNGELLGYVFIVKDVTNSVTKQKLLSIENKLSTLLNLAKSVDDAMNQFLNCALEIVSIDGGGVYFVNPTTYELILKKHKGLSEEFIALVSHFEGSSSQAKVVKMGKIIFDRYCDIAPTMDEVRANENLKGVALIPIKHEGQTVAFVNLASKKWDSFCKLTKNTIISISVQLGSTIGKLRAEELLEESENRFRTTFDQAADGIFIIEITENEGPIIRDANKVALLNHGYTSEELIGKPITILDSEKTKRKIPERTEKILSGNCIRFEAMHVRKDGTSFLLEISARKILINGKSYIYSIERDITERKIAEEKLKISEERFRSIFSNISNVAVQGYNKDRKVFYWNKASEQIYQYSKEEALNKKLEDLIIPSEMKEHLVTSIANLYEKNIPIQNGELTLIRKDRSLVPVYSSHVMIEKSDGEKEMFCVDIDISEQKIAEEKIKKSLKEKEVLLKEVHHRVKNNMQIVMSLLNLQANTIEDERIRKALAESSNRIRAMGLIHEVLYQSENLSSIDPEEYIGKLIQSTTRAYGSIDKKIKHKLNIEKVELSLDETIPLALIINELLTNTYKYAFPNRNKGNIDIILKSKKDNIIILKYFDNGIGMASNIIPRELNSLGLKLVYDLAEGQLKGSVKVSRRKGTRYRIEFTKRSYKK
jgi:PAS domain S-box-containing protein